MVEKPSYEKQIHDVWYVQGQISAVFSLVVAVANLVDKDEFRESAIQRIEAIRVGNFAQPVPESFLDGVDEIERRVQIILS